MRLIDKTERSQFETISLEADLPHPPEKVWRALTNPALLAEWLLPVVDHKLETGAAFRLQAPPQPGWDGTVECRYLEIEPLRKIRWSWVVGDIDTIVTATLWETGGGTRLRIEQSGFKPHQKQNFGGARYGWSMMGERLVGLLERMN